MKTILLCAAILLSALSVRGQIIFQEDFEGTTGTSLPSGWIVDSGKFGISTSNPLVSGIDTSSRVLAFSASTNSNDTFSALFDLSPYLGSAHPVLLTFDFLSNATTNHAGLIGLSEGNDISSGSTGIWQDGSPASQPGASPVYSMSGTGSWESVSIDISSYINARTSPQLQSTSLSFEQWSDASVANSVPVYFDNLQIASVPEPGMYGLFTGFLALAFVIRRKRTK